MNSTNIGATVNTHYLQYDVTWASIVLLYYDWLLTIPEEVEYIWKARLSLTTVFYVLCRYALLANVLYLLEISNLLGSRCVDPLSIICGDSSFSLSLSCDDWKKFVSALSVFGRAAIIATLIARTYAVCSKNRWIVVYLIALGIVCVVTDALHVPTEKCVDSEDPAIASALRSFFMIAFETSVACLTTIRTVQALRAGGPWKSQRHRLMFLIFEEGVLYFCVVSVLTTASVILDIRAPTGFLQRLLDGLTLPLSGALTARFILHLRAWQAKRAGVYVISTARSHGEPQGNAGFSSCDARIVDVEAIFKPVSSIGQFGEDPVARVLRQSESGTIVVQVDVELSA
ncbi:hypothetical protein F5050DRAFT_1788344 [Lentinula boryana]|uniref:DUF6533 domain-containing protein n=1 Tax=Lentinula boryana TaxID=40481 RepID=A0ABQ8Q1Y4_9AGAR|nr:hypothetical protein F5050DRAFT_1788344 [Lentinula boryana]